MGANGDINKTGVRLTRPEGAVQSFGHEAAHSVGVDVSPDNAVGHHPNAEQRG